MAEIGYATLGIIPSFDGFERKLSSGTSGTMSKIGGASGTQFGDAAGRSAGSRFGSVFKSAAKAGILGIAAIGAAAGAAAFKFGGDALEEAREAQKVGALTTNTIKATGGAAKVTAGHVATLSGAISEKAGIDDEVIQRGANMLLTFKNIRNEVGKGSKIFDRTTKAMADMAAGMAGGKGGEIDMKSSSILLGKALNDPVKGLSALSRVGIQFTDQQKAINTALVEGGNVAALNALGFKVSTADFAKAQKDRKMTAEETVKFFTGPMSDAEQKYFDHLAEGGHTLEAQQNILKEVNSQFKGAAAAQATDAEKLQVAWGNFKEEVGTELLPVMDKLVNYLRDKGIPLARKFFGWVKDTGVPAFKDFAEKMRPLAKSLLPAAGDALEIMWKAAKKAAPFVKDMVDAFLDMPDWAKTALVGGGAAAFAGKKLGVFGGGGGATGLVGKAVGAVKPTKVFETNPAALGGGGVGGKGGGKIAGAVATAASAVGGGGLAFATFAGIGTHWSNNKLNDAMVEQAGKEDGERYARSFASVQSQGGGGGMGLPTLTIGGEPKKEVDALVDSVDRFKGSLDLVGAKKVNPDLRIPNIMQEQNRLGSFASKLDLVGNKKIRPNLQLTGVDHARAQVDDLLDGMNTLASLDVTGVIGLAAVGASAATRGRGGGRPRNAGRDQQRQRNLGGTP